MTVMNRAGIASSPAVCDSSPAPALDTPGAENVKLP
jgi:hypothetical protein